MRTKRPLGLFSRRKSFLRSPSPCSSILNWHATLGSSRQHGLFIRLAIYETGLPSAFASCDNKFRFIPCLHRRFSAGDALPLTCLSIDACYPSPCFVSATIHFETFADSKYLAIDASLCTPQTLVQLLTHNGLCPFGAKPSFSQKSKLPLGLLLCLVSGHVHIPRSSTSQ